jgi:defect-in-organelle-trafficking protein DotC
MHRISLIVAASLLSACSFIGPQHEVDPTNLHQLQNMSVDTVPRRDSVLETGQLRAKALQDIALGLGAQGGLAWASGQIDVNLEKDKRHLENIFNFNAMMLSHGVLPPVLEQADNSLILDDPNTIRVSDKTYKIVKQAHFATTPPNWREYLWLPYSKPELPDKVLLPRNNAERRVWSKYIKLGWESGVQQAYDIFQQNLATLKRDYQGMILYRKLLEEKMINPPFVSKTELGITGDGKVMRINDQVLRITELPHLQTNSHGWKAIVVKQ